MDRECSKTRPAARDRATIAARAFAALRSDDAVEVERAARAALRARLPRLAAKLSERLTLLSGPP